MKKNIFKRNIFFYTNILLFVFINNSSSEEFKLNLSFSPFGEQIEFVLDPKGKILLKTQYFENRTCEEADFFIDIFRDWKKSLGENLGPKDKSMCVCGYRNIERETFKFFKEKFYEKNKIAPWELRKKAWAIYDLNQVCYSDLSGQLPKKMEEITKKQLIKILDSNFLHDRVFDNSGVNCYSAVMESLGYLNSPRYVSPYEFNSFLNSPFCTKISPMERRTGDVLSFKGNSHKSIYPVHGAVYLKENILFEKKGSNHDFPYQIGLLSDAKKIHLNDPEYFRCKNKESVSETYGSINGFNDVLHTIEEIESCFLKSYFMDFKRENIYGLLKFVKQNLDVVSNVINQRKDNLEDPKTKRPKKESEMEYELWCLLEARIKSMKDGMQMHVYLRSETPLGLVNEMNRR